MYSHVQMSHLHPALSSFPPVLLLLALGLELAAWFGNADARRFVRIVLWIAVPCVLAAFFSGYQASETANRTFTVADELIAQHHNIGRLLAFFIIPCAALELVTAKASHGKRIFEVLYRFVLATCVGLVVYAGYLGGDLVFKHGAGVYAPVPSQPAAP